ncbi:MFS transporter [Pelosinus sp. sgz500959]|uniref:MFS transporter n=1 Tax=Pelosinus sp. sgz500959 TaxID=3242472 RepID=UPI0036725EA0
MSQPEKVLEKMQKSVGKKTNYRWVVMGLIFGVWAIACADRANLGVALPFMKKEFGFSNTEAGAIVSLFAFSYAVVQIPAGLFYKRISTKTQEKIFPVFLLLVSVFTGLMGTTSSTFLLKLYRVGLGVAEGPLGIGCTNIMNRWFPAKEKGTAMGLWNTASKLGAVIAPPVCVLIAEMYGWREIFYVFAIPGIFLAVAWMFLVKNSPSDSKFCSPAEVSYIQNTQAPAVSSQSSTLRSHHDFGWLDKLNRTKKVAPLQTIGQVFRSWNVIGNALAYGCMIGISNTFMMWIPSYLMNVKGFTSIKMGFLASAPFIGSVIGNTLGGWFSDRVLDKRRKPTMLLAALCTIIMMVALIYAPNNALYLGLMLMLSGLLIGFGFSGYTVYPMGLTTKEAYPLAFAIVNTGGQLGGACAPLIVGIILDAYSWNAVFIYLAISSIICFTLVTTIDEPMDDAAPTNTAV